VNVEHLHPTSVRVLMALLAWDGPGPPSVRDLGALVGLRSSSSVHHHLGELRRAGLLDWEPRRQCTLRLTVHRVRNAYC
jgi:SOS-response transcriptional repressor LexA